MSLRLKRLNEKLRNEKGQGLVEYALILVLIALVVMAAVHTVGSTTSQSYTNINTRINNPQ